MVHRVPPSNIFIKLVSRFQLRDAGKSSRRRFIFLPGYRKTAIIIYCNLHSSYFYKFFSDDYKIECIFLKVLQKKISKSHSNRTIAISDLGRSEFSYPEDLSLYEIFTKTIKNAGKLSKKFVTKLPCLALFVSHMSSSNLSYCLAFWLPKYFYDQLEHEENPSVQPWEYNVVPWIGSLPGSILSGVICDKLIQSGKYSTSTVRRMCQFFAMVVPAVLIHYFLLRSDLSIRKEMIVISISVFCANFHHAAAMVNPQDLAPNSAGTLFGIMNCCGALSSAFGTWFTGYLLEVNNKDWHQVFIYVSTFCYIGAFSFLVFGTGKRLF